MGTEKELSALIICLSPHGTTRKAVAALSESFVENGLPTDICYLNEFKGPQEIESLHTMIPSYPLVVFGAPTYFHHAPPVFTDFMRKIPGAGHHQAAAILTTFGGVSSGVIQLDLAKILFKKQYNLIGGIQVLTEHCLTFQDAHPFYGGHPDKNDMAAIREFGKDITMRLKDENNLSFTPAAFNDKPPVMNFIDNYFNSLRAFSWAMPSVRVNEAACTRCGLCLKNCPTHNIRLEQVVVHGKNCINCYCCVRHCPSGAATAFLKPTAAIPKYLARIFARYEAQTTRQVV